MQLGRSVSRYLLGTLLVVALIAGGITARIWQFGQASDPQVAEAIVVLGAAQYDGRPSQVFAQRLDHAAELLRAGDAPMIVTVGGGQPDDTTTEAAAGKKYLKAAGISGKHVKAIDVGDDTLTSLRAAADYFEEQNIGSIIVVTDPWHSARSRMIARDLGLTVQVSPVEQGPATQSKIRQRYIGRELLASIFYRLTGGSSGSGGSVL